MSEHTSSSPEIPVLTDVIPARSPLDTSEPERYPTDIDTLIAELQTNLAARAYALTEQLLHSAFSELEATLFEQVTTKLRQELPELIDSVLREQLGADDEQD